MKILRFWWDEENIEHIANHGVEQAEAEATIENAALLRKTGRGKYIAYGKTDSGRLLIVVRTPFLTSPVDLHLRSDFFQAIELLAARRGIPYQLLIQSWLKEKLSQEAPELLPTP